MFHDNKIESIAKETITITTYDVWVSYFGMSLYIKVTSHLLSSDKIYVAANEDGDVHVGGNSPCILAGHNFWSGFNGFCNKLGSTGDCLPVCWKDSLVEYKL